MDLHDRHDPALISAVVAGDLAGADLDTATERLRDCRECASPAADLRAIAGATRSLPAPTRPAGTDFRLTPHVATRLARGRVWRRVLRPFGSRASGMRLLAPAFTTLGLVGLLVSGLPLLAPTSGGTATMAEAGHGQAPYAAFSAAPAAPAGSPVVDSSAGARGPADFNSTAAPGVVKTATAAPGGTNSATAAPGALGAVTSAPRPPTEDTGGHASPVPPRPAGLLFVSAGLLVAGLALVVVRRRARRLP